MTFKLFLTLTLVGCLSAALTTAQGQNFQYNNQLAEVSFINGKSSEMILIRSDDNREYYFPQWKPSESRPVGYVSSSFLRVEAKFRFTCKPSAEVWVKGKCSNGFSLPPQKLHFESSQPTLGIYDGADSDQKFQAEMVDYFEAFKIEWTVTTDPTSNNWIQLGESSNQLYVTHKSPFVATPFHTLIHIGCTNSVGLTNQDEIVEAIYGEFRDRSVKKLNGTTDLGYWRGANPLNTRFCRTITGFLFYEDAACGEWATFLSDIYRIQGIVSNLVAIEWTVPALGIGYKLTTQSRVLLEEDVNNKFGLTAPRYDNLADYRLLRENEYAADNAFFYVKNWLVGSNRSFGECAYSANSYNTCLDDFMGISGQGNSDPRAFFENHAIVGYKKLDGSYIYYDPSYGTGSYASIEEWETASLDGFGTLIYFKNTNSGIEMYSWYQEQNEPSTTLVTPRIAR